MSWNTTSTPQKKSGEILNRLIALAGDHHVVDSFTLLKAKREAKDLIKVDAAAAHLVLGVIACLEGDVGELHRRHRLAIKLSSNPTHAIAQYAVSLSRLSLFDEAIEQMEAIVEHSPEDRTALGLLIMTCYRAGRIRTADHWLTFWHQRFPNVHHEQEPLIRQTLEFARSKKIADSDLASKIKVAVNLVVERNVPQGSWEGGLSAGDDDKWIDYRLRLFAEPSEVADLCEVLAERYAAIESNPVGAVHYMVGYGIESAEPVDGGNA